VAGSAPFPRLAPKLLKLPVREALRRYRRLIIVGDPGSGKTTLLRWLAVTFAAGRQGDPDRLGPNFTEPCLPILLERDASLSVCVCWPSNHRLSTSPRSSAATSRVTCASGCHDSNPGCDSRWEMFSYFLTGSTKLKIGDHVPD
jgi:hypothetical protein